MANRVRAAAPAYPANARKRDGTIINFTGCLAGGRPGQVLLAAPGGYLIATSDGAVWLNTTDKLYVGEVLD